LNVEEFDDFGANVVDFFDDNVVDFALEDAQVEVNLCDVIETFLIGAKSFHQRHTQNHLVNSLKRPYFLDLAPTSLPNKAIFHPRNKLSSLLLYKKTFRALRRGQNIHEMPTQFNSQCVTSDNVLSNL
jgi:hypothetical protein